MNIFIIFSSSRRQLFTMSMVKKHTPDTTIIKLNVGFREHKLC